MEKKKLEWTSCMVFVKSKEGEKILDGTGIFLFLMGQK